jgi:hypothetical protein
MRPVALKTTAHAAERCRLLRKGGRRCTTVLAAAAVMLCMPGLALAADPPTILSAGIDGADQLYATWSLGADTNFSHVDFSTVATPHPTLPEFFAEANFAAFDCAPPPDACTASPTSTSFTDGFPAPRDRRYFVKVTAVANSAPDALTSAIWVIDETKPVIAGDAPLGASPPSNSPVSGHPLQEGTSPAPPPAAPPAPAAPTAAPAPPAAPPPPSPPPPPPPPRLVASASITVLSLPKSIRAVVRSGVKLRVTCARAACTAAGSLLLNGQALVRKGASIPAGATRTLVLRPAGTRRSRLRKLSRARLRISATVTPAGGAPQRVSRLFTVRR